jgi:hypothetical protein
MKTLIGKLFSHFFEYKKPRKFMKYSRKYNFEQQEVKLPKFFVFRGIFWGWEGELVPLNFRDLLGTSFMFRKKSQITPQTPSKTHHSKQQKKELVIKINIKASFTFSILINKKIFLHENRAKVFFLHFSRKII